MAQHDYVIANGTGAAVRSDLNNALSAIVSQNSGATEPATMYAYQWWADTTTGLLKIRNAANNAWVTVGTLASANLGLLSSGGTVTAALGSASTPGITFTGDTNTGIYSPGADQVAISTNGTGRLFVDASGRVLVGTSTSLSTNAGFTPNLQVAGTVTDAAMSVFQYRNATGAGGSLTLSHSRGASVGTQTILQNGDSFGILLFEGSDGTNPVQGALIKGEVDGTPGTNDMPGRIVLSTTADGASSPTERMRIDSSGRVGIGTTAFPASTPIQVKAVGAGAGGYAIVSANDENAGGIILNSSSDNSVRIEADPGSLRASSYINLSVDGTERARIDSSGRLLVGTSSNTRNATLVLQGHSGDYANGPAHFRLNRANSSPPNGGDLGYIFFGDSDNGSDGAAWIVGQRDGGTWSASSKPGRLVFSTTADGASSPTERIRIKNDGVTSFGQGATGPGSGVAGTLINAGDGGILITNNTAPFLRCYTLNGGFPNALQIANNGNVTNANNSYGAISDIKLKENIVDANSQWDDLKALQVRNYNLKEGQTHTQIGLVAQEVELVSPGLVSESPDRDAEGNDLGTVTKSVNYSVLYMKAVKALQEAMERIEQLEAKVAALESA